MSSADNRSVHTDALATLGTIHAGPQGRDAIHLAVIQARAGESLSPGCDVRVENGWAYHCGEGDPRAVGIVDPFLSFTDPQWRLEGGELFWVVIYPRVITSLRHVWTHPALPNEDGLAPKPEPSVTASEAWLREFAAKADCPSYDILILAATDGYRSEDGECTGGLSDWSDDHLHFRGMDAHGDIPPEFWDHLEVVTGKKVRDRPKYFSCSC